MASSPLSVFSRGAASVTTADSVKFESYFQSTSMRKVWATGTAKFWRTYFLKPATLTVSSYVPAGTWTV